MPLIKYSSIGRQAAIRLIASLGLLVLFIAASSLSIYQAALRKASEARTENQASFFAARLMQLERDWEIQSRDFKVRLEFTRMLEDPATAVANLQAFMTVQGTNRRFNYLLIQTKNGQKIFDFGKDLNLPSIPYESHDTMGHYLDPDSGNLYRVFEMPIWLGEQRGMVGQCAVFFRIDNALLGQLSAPGVTISAIHHNKPVASSGGHIAIDRLRQKNLAEESEQGRMLPWGGAKADDSIQLHIDAPMVTLFSSLEIAIGMSIIPIVDGLMLWFTVGVWLMRQTRRITQLGEAVGEYTTTPQVSTTMRSRLIRAKDDQADEITDVAEAIGTMVDSIDHREREREEAITSLRQSETRIREITTALGDGVLVLNTEGLITFVNPRAEKLLGFSREELLDQNSHTTLRHHLPLDTCPLFDALRQQREYRSEMEHLVRKDGSLLPVALAATPIYRESDFGGMVITFQDMTEQLAIQQSLQEAKTEAERANNAKSDFLANMSHEIRTPMNAVIGLSDLALGLSGLDHTLRDYLGKIRVSSMALLSIINDILDYSKIEAGRMEIEVVEFRLQNLLMNVIDLVNVRAEQKGLKVVLDLAPEIPPVLIGDPLRLSQVLNNLVGNALKFTEKGQIDLEVIMLGQRDENKTLQFSVRDTGIGLSPNQAKQLFQPFTQADGSITRRFGGTGLGLTICKHLVDMMGGKIAVDSVLGRGSCFSFTLPLREADGEWDDISHIESECRLLVDRPQAYYNLFEQAAPIHGAQVLLVEDNEINQTVAHDLLIRMGLRVTVVDNGEQALEILHHKTFDVVLMDLQMMLMDGFETTRRIRELPRFAELPVIAMTAAVLDSDREACKAAGMNDHVAKPIMPQNLLATLLKWIKIDADGTLTYSRNSPEYAEGVLQPMFRDSHNLFKHLNLLFAKQFAESDSVISQLIAEGKLPEAAKLAHKIKGAAGNLGAHELQQATNILETALGFALAAQSAMEPDNIKGSDEKLTYALKSFKKALAEVMKFVTQFDGEEAPSPIPVENECDNCDWQRVGNLLTQLRKLIAGYDFVPQELLIELRESVGCRSLQKQVDRCRRYLEFTDYDKAKAVLDEISA